MVSSVVSTSSATVSSGATSVVSSVGLLGRRGLERGDLGDDRGEGVLDGVRQGADGADTGEGHDGHGGAGGGLRDGAGGQELGDQGGEDHGGTSPCPDAGGPPLGRAPGRSGRPDGRARLVGEKTSGQQLGKGGVGPSRPGRARPDRPGEGGQSGRPLGDGPAREDRLEGVLDGGVVGCCGHLTPVIAGRAPRGTRTPEVFSDGFSSRSRRRPQATPLERLHRAHRAPHDPGDLLHRQVGEHPQEQHGALVVGQPGAHPVDVLGADADQRVVLGVPAGEQREVRVVVGELGTAAAPPPVVDQPAVGDGEDPAAQGLLVAR